MAKGKLRSNCMGYWIALRRKEEILAKKCLQTRPVWMEDNLEYIWNQPIRKIMMPGEEVWIQIKLYLSDSVVIETFLFRYSQFRSISSEEEKITESIS